jgi:hypothetical protein
MKTYNVKIIIPDDIADTRKLDSDLEFYEGYGSVQYQTWRNLCELKQLPYNGGFEAIFTFNNEKNAHTFNNIWDKDIEGISDEI